MITVGYSASGKRLRRTIYGKTKGEVTAGLTRLQIQKLDGILSPRSTLTIGDHLDRWLEDAVTMGTRPTTYQSYSQLVRLQIKPLIGGLKLAKFMPANLPWFYAELARKGRSRRIQYQCHGVIHRALEIAVRWGLVVRNVGDAAERPTVRVAEVTPLTPEQVRAFLKASESDRLHGLYVLALSTGARQGELYGLEWPDVDFEAGTIQIRRTIVELDGVFHVHEPKTEKGKRLIVLPAVAVDALHAQRTRLMTEGLAACPLVFPDTVGGFLRRGSGNHRAFKRILKTAGLPETTRFHDPRHSHATMLLLAGVHPRVCQDRLGHSQISVTLGV